jgi:hypothetical protein
MRARALISFASLASLAVLVSAAPVHACQPTGYNGLTAAVVNPSAAVTGDVDATGCDIGVFVDQGSATIKDAEIHGALWFGVAAIADANPVSLNVSGSWIHAIGDVPHNGVQRGVGIYVRGFFTNATNARITGNTIEDVQKAGIVTNGRSTHATVSDNVVTGLGPVNFIASNGIQIGYGADAAVTRNVVSGFSYTGTSDVSGGITIVGGPGYGSCPDGNPCAYTVGTRIIGNEVDGSDIGVFLTNIDGLGLAPSVATNVSAIHNTITNDALNNMYGGTGYQAGVSDVGNGDKIIANRISGDGYDPAAYPGAYVVEVDADTSFTNKPKVHANK